MRIRTTIDPFGGLPDGDRTNDIVELAIPGCGDGVRGDGEDCDAGPDGGACCTADCRFAAAGTPCRPAAGACDAAETCTGSSATCPRDGAGADGTPCGPGTPPCMEDRCQGGTCRSTPVPDGTACGAGLPPCIADECRAGACTRIAAGGWCVVDATCIPPGTLTPDGCRTCAPERARDRWTPIAGADPAGLRCLLGGVATAADDTCAAGARRRLVRRLVRLERLLTRIVDRDRRALRARFARTSRALQRLAARTRCAAAEAEALRVQARAYAAAVPRGGGGAK
jgi:hypothetical protein